MHDVEGGGEAEVVVRPPLAPAPGTASPVQEEEEETGEQGNSETLTKLTLPTPPKDFGMYIHIQCTVLICLTLLASFFLSSHLSLKHVYVLST